MSGGDSKPDPYYGKDPPKRRIVPDVKELPKVYRDAVKPKRIELLPNGRKQFVYDCEHCGKEGKWDSRKTAKHAFCDRKCFGEWQKYARPPRKLSPEGARRIGQRTKELWADPEHRKNVSKKNSEANKRQYASGERDPYKTIAKARESLAKMYENKTHPFFHQDFRGDNNPAKSLVLF